MRQLSRRPALGICASLGTYQIIDTSSLARFLTSALHHSTQDFGDEAPDAASAMAKVRAATTEFGVGVGKDERVKVVKDTANYLRLEYTNLASGAVDDVEFFIPGVHVFRRGLVFHFPCSSHVTTDERTPATNFEYFVPASVLRESTTRVDSKMSCPPSQITT